MRMTKEEFSLALEEYSAETARFSGRFMILASAGLPFVFAANYYIESSNHDSESSHFLVIVCVSFIITGLLLAFALDKKVAKLGLRCP
ncbi:MAG: hypothetical protein AAF558_06280 [Verrucomicrobiota bacterium]